MRTKNQTPREGTVVGTIDMTPTWESIMLIHAVAAANGSTPAIEELQRAGRLADKLMRLSKLFKTDKFWDTLATEQQEEIVKALEGK